MTNTLPADDGGKSTPWSQVTKASDGEFAFFGDAPLIPGENRHEYEQLLARVTAALKPADVFETIWVGEFVYLHWEVRRLRRISVALVKIRYDESKLDEAFRFGRTGTDADKGGDIAHIVAGNIEVLRNLEAMTAAAELRRDAAYQQIEKHRTGLGDLLRRAVEQLGNADSQKLEDRSGEEKRAA
jgi:hypothetical protein